MEQPGQTEQRRILGPYFVGALLIYGICVLGAGILFSSKLGVAIHLGLVGGICPFIPLASIHFVIQKELHRITIRWIPSKSRGAWAYLWMNLPALLWFLAILISAALPPGQEAKLRMFKAVTEQNPPASLQMVGFDRQRGLNDGHYNLVFQISETDFSRLVASLNLTLEQSNLDSLALSPYRQMAEIAGGTNFKFEAPGKLYSLTSTKASANETMHSKTSIIVGTNCQEVLLINSFF